MEAINSAMHEKTHLRISRSPGVLFLDVTFPDKLELSHCFASKSVSSVDDECDVTLSTGGAMDFCREGNPFRDFLDIAMFLSFQVKKKVGWRITVSFATVLAPRTFQFSIRTILLDCTGRMQSEFDR